MAVQSNTDNCPVCLRELGNSKIGKLPCSHIFCFLCIEEWSKNMNTCPIDRSRYDCIKIYLHVHGKCIGEVAVEDKSIKDLFAEDDNTICELCHSTTDEHLLLLCDGCDRGFHTYCLTPPLTVVPEGSWYCPRCLPIVTSAECLTDSDSYHNDIHSSNDDDDIVNSMQRKSVRISSDSSSNEDDGSNFSTNDLVSSMASSQEELLTSDVDSSVPSEQSIDSQDTIASRVSILHSSQPASSDDCLLNISNHSNHTHQQLLEQSSHGDSIKRRLRKYSNGHRVCATRSSTGSLAKCILSISDSDQSDTEYKPLCGSNASSSCHTHFKMHQVKTRSHKTAPTAVECKSRGVKRRRRIKHKRRKRQRKLRKSSLQYPVATSTRVLRRARTAATSPRAVADTPQSVIRRLAKARCQTESLEEARRMSQVRPSPGQMTQNDIIAHHVRSKQREQLGLWWDRKVIECYKTSTRVVCSPLKNAMKRHPLISPASLKYLDKSHDTQRPQFMTSNDIIGNIFANMDTLYNKDAVVLRTGQIAAPHTHKNKK